jgi:nicotinamidase-related amidase
MQYDLILLDIEAQRDFFVPGGSCYTPAAETPRENLARLFAWVRENDVPVMSTVLRVAPGQVGPLADSPHCIEGSEGEGKLTQTLVAPYINLGLRNTTDLPPEIFFRYRQVIFEKRDPDIFQHQRAERLITELAESKKGFVLAGAGVSHGLYRAAIGLRSRGFPVILAVDAVATLQHPWAQNAMDRMLAKGVHFAKTREIVTQPKPRKRRRVSFREELNSIQG